MPFPSQIPLTDWNNAGPTDLPEDFGAGDTNTARILGYDEDAPAVKLCWDYEGGSFENWHLPSQNELLLFWTNIVDDGSGDNSGAGNMLETGYWTSTRLSNDYLAQVVNFANGATIEVMDSSADFPVRAVRWF